MSSKMSPIGRVLVIALISGLTSGIIVTAIMWFVFASAWFFFIIPAVMGWAIKKYAHISASEVDADENLQNKVGWTCAGITLFFVLLTAFVVALATYAATGSMWGIFLNIIFYVASGFAVWYGHSRGVQAVVDSYYESDLKE